MEKFHIEKNTVQETLVIPLYGRKICSERFPDLFRDPEAERICGMLDYDFETNGEKMESTAGLFGALEVAQRQYDIACDLNDDRWMDRIDASGGAIFFATGVFYYFRTEDVKKLFSRLAMRFPGGVMVFDTCNRRGAKMMTKTWLKEAGITDVGAYFSVEEPADLISWSPDFAEVSSKSYMRGYRDIYSRVGFIHRLLIRLCDNVVNMRIVKIEFRG